MNEAVWIEHCPTSSVNQSQEGVAILVQENCSDDGSIEIISKFASNFPNIYLFKNSSRVNSWKNWGLLMNNAIEHFSFEYLFWIGGDDYLYELDFIHNLYREGKRGLLPIVSLTIVVINGEDGQQKENIKIALSSKIKLIRIMQYCNNWRNVNIFHSLISREIYLQLFKSSGNTHTNYIYNDWWVVLSIISKSRVLSLESSHFYKSQWNVRRYQWTSDTKKDIQRDKENMRVKRYLELVFQDAIIFCKHALRPHPLKKTLTPIDNFIVIFIFFMRALFGPTKHLSIYVFRKLAVYFRYHNAIPR